MSNSTTIPELTVLECLHKIVIAIDEAGKALTATSLKRQLGLSDTEFDAAAEYGCEIKVIEWGTRNFYSALKPYVIPEEAYYNWVKIAIENLWSHEGYDKSAFYIENTSRRDSKIEGPWTRPDLTLVCHRKFPWTIGTEFDVVTFEIKRPDSANVLAVFEALSHAAAATRAYVVFPVDAEVWRLENPAQERRVRDECIRHGVGLILVSNVGGEPKGHHLLKAARREIDHEKCSNFLDAVVSLPGKRRISEWKS
ncbi:hypothetical protein ACHMW5_09615 [Azospirillum melinis]|uniref:hypothetical protein n=1 Tax=Azospirillum melinis TaxID=328839 RepID=UPI003756B1C0